LPGMLGASGLKLNLSSGIASAASTPWFSTASMSRSTTDAMVGADCGDGCEPEALTTALIAARWKAGPATRAPAATQVRNNNIRAFFIECLPRFPELGCSLCPNEGQIVADSPIVHHKPHSLLRNARNWVPLQHLRDQGNFPGANRSSCGPTSPTFLG